MDVFASVQGLVGLVLFVLTLGVKAFAFVDAVRRPKSAYEMVGRQSKTFWMIVLGIALLAGLISSPIGLLGLVGLVAALIYIFGIRPELQQYGGGGRGRGGERTGPYGPW